MAPTAAFLVLLALMSDPFCFHQNGIILAPNAPLLTLRRPILVITACSHISYAGNTHNNHKVCMAEWLDGHLGSSRSRVETLLE